MNKRQLKVSHKGLGTKNSGQKKFSHKKPGKFKGQDKENRNSSRGEFQPSREGRHGEFQPSREGRRGEFQPYRERSRDFKPQRATEYEALLGPRLSEADLRRLVMLSARKIQESLQYHQTSINVTPEKASEFIPEKAAPRVDRGFAKAQASSSPAPSPKSPLISPSHEAKKRPLDPWQEESLEALLSGQHLIVDAPTSAGKTRVIEAFLDARLSQGAKLIYTSPVKSLSNDKYLEFTEKYGKDLVGINTGDFKENLHAPIILATLETYRNSLLGIEPNISRKVIVYDEYHYLQDESRGSAWEESMILTPKNCQLVLLSASVPNADEFAEWITELTGRPTKVIRVKERPVPLTHVVQTKFGLILADELNIQNNEYSLMHKANKQERQEKRWRRGKDVYQSLIPPVLSCIDLNMVPLIIYAGRRIDAEGIAVSLARFFRSDFQGEMADKLRERLKTLQGWEYVPPELQRLISRFGIGYHHSGIIPPGRVAVEALLKEGLLRICAGTMGISLGVNFAVRSALIFDESRPGESGETRYSNTEVMQMLGRAGRRGQDRQGFSIWLNLGRYALLQPKDRERCESSLKFDPTTVLGVLGQHPDLNYLSSFYKKSFFMYNNGTQKVHNTKEKILNNIVKHLQRVGALEGATPTRLGNIARHFPQSGGLLIASWFAQDKITANNFHSYLQAMATFGSAHFKDIPETYADLDFLHGLRIPEFIDKFYPDSLFPELYDDFKSKHGDDPFEEKRVVFREFNLGAASLVKMWLNPKTQWDALIEEHSSKYFSAGDCMNVLFRFATFLQSCARLDDVDPQIPVEASRLLRVLLREPLDARNRMLADEDEPEENAAEK